MKIRTRGRGEEEKPKEQRKEKRGIKRKGIINNKFKLFNSTYSRLEFKSVQFGKKYR